MKTLTRSLDDRWIGGVCGGLSAYTGIDAGVIRLILAVGTVLGAGSLLIAYVVVWILVPKQNVQPAVWAPATDPTATPHEPARPSA